MKYTVDCKTSSTKKAFLTEMQKAFGEMYSLNYDSFIDGARGAEATVEVLDIGCYEDPQTLREVFEIIERENPSVKFITKR